MIQENKEFAQLSKIWYYYHSYFLAREFNAFQSYKYFRSTSFCQTLQSGQYTIVSKRNTVPVFAISFLSRVIEGTYLSFPGKCMLLAVIALKKPTLQKLELMAFHKRSSHSLSGRLPPPLTLIQLHSCVRLRERPLPLGMNGNEKGPVKQSVWQAQKFYTNRLKRKAVNTLP